MFPRLKFLQIPSSTYPRQIHLSVSFIFQFSNFLHTLIFNIPLTHWFIMSFKFNFPSVLYNYSFKVPLTFDGGSSLNKLTCKHLIHLVFHIVCFNLNLKYSLHSGFHIILCISLSNFPLQSNFQTALTISSFILHLSC